MTKGNRFINKDIYYNIGKLSQVYDLYQRF